MEVVDELERDGVELLGPVERDDRHVGGGPVDTDGVHAAASQKIMTLPHKRS